MFFYLKPFCFVFKFLKISKGGIRTHNVELPSFNCLSIASTIPPPDYFATFRLPPELLTVPTHDLERFILSQRTYSIFVPLYFGLISLFLILLPFYFGTNLLIFKYEFFKGTGYLVADDRLELPI